MENQILVLPQEVEQIAQNVSVEKRTEVQNVLNHVFNGVSKMREQLDTVNVADHNDKVGMKLANTIRLEVRQVRLEAEKTFDAKRAEVQQAMLSFKTEDALWLKAKQTMQILTKEIEENARWKEETAKRFEAEQKELKIQQRILKISKYAPELDRSNFEAMSDEAFDLFYNGVEKQYNEKIEAERKAEEERIAKEKAEAEERERIRLENVRLKAEAEAKEKQLQEERAKAEAERKILEEQAKKEREEMERKAQEERAKQEAILKAEKEARQKLEAEKLAEEQAKLQAKKEAGKLEKAPVKQQLSSWVNSFELPNTSVKNDLSNEIKAKFEAFKKWSLTQINNL